jgi:hypothetical protein
VYVADARIRYMHKCQAGATARLLICSWCTRWIRKRIDVSTQDLESHGQKTGSTVSIEFRKATV